MKETLKFFRSLSEIAEARRIMRTRLVFLGFVLNLLSTCYATDAFTIMKGKHLSIAPSNVSY